MREDGRRFGLTRRRLLGGVAAVGAAAAGAGAGTWAYFADAASSDNNTVQAGTLDLEVTNGATLAWTISNAAPGDGQIGRLDVDLSNIGSLAADHAEIDFSHTPHEDADGDLSSTDAGPESDSVNGADGMAAFVRIEVMDYVDTGATIINLKEQISDANGNGFIDLEDVANPNNEHVLDDLDPPVENGGTETEFQIDVTVDPSMPNAYQGDVLETTVTFALHQDASQDG